MTVLQSASVVERKQHDEIGVLEIWRILQANKLLICAVTLIVGLSAAAVTLYSPNIYRAQAVLIPSGEAQSPQIAAQFGFAANLAGVDLSRPDDKTVKALATLRSREFLSQFIRQHDLLPWLFASEYDEVGKVSVIDESIYSTETNTWLDSTAIPTEGAAFNEFQELVIMQADQSTGLVTVTIEWIDPYLAAQWVNWLVSDVNNHLRTNDMQEAQRAIDYLRSQLSSTQLIEMQRVFYQLIESQTRTLMLGDIREGYVFEIIDPAIAADEKSKPLRLLSTLLGLIFGSVLAIFFVLVRHFIRTE